MPTVFEVPIECQQPRRFRRIIPRERFAAFHQAARRAAGRLRGATVWNVNSTERGGGVAEMLRSLLGYARGAGVDARWLVIEGDPEFFEVTKRLHNWLHGSPGDDGQLDGEARAVYERVLGEAGEELGRLVAPGDVVLLHDPQTAGLVSAARRLGAVAIWRSHVGTEGTSELTEAAWAFLQPYLQEADACVFSCEEYVWAGLDRERVRLIMPSIDAFSPKNRDLSAAAVRSILSGSGIVPDPGLDGPSPVSSVATMVEDEPVPASAPIVVQVSRWDGLKDPVGVIRGFSRHIAPGTAAHLVVAGPSSDAVADDPEGTEVLESCVAARADLPAEVRARVHLACLPMHDTTENALMVNALQRRADVVVQKSLAEGFGLTVAEAMWKARPVVASGVGGIVAQVEHGRTGLLVRSPSDLAEFGEAVRTLLEHRERAEAMGQAACEAVREQFLAPRHLRQYAELMADLCASGEAAESAAS